MTDLRTAAQQALEALEYHVEQTRPIHRTSEAITALRAALAEPVQEPVAHFGSAYVNENGVHITTVLGPVAIPQDAKLYAAPPQRKPLTQEEAATLVVQDNRMRGEFSAAMELIRRTEQAHGIKE